MNLATRRIYGCGCYARLGQGYSVRTEKDNLHKFLSLALFGPKKVFDGFESDMVRGQAYVAFQALERGSSSYEGSHMVTTSLKADWQINNDDALTFELERVKLHCCCVPHCHALTHLQ